MNQDLKDKHIAIVGGAGFIGHNMAINFSKRGAKVHVLDSLQINNLLTMADVNNTLENRDWYLKMIGERLDLIKECKIDINIQDARDYNALSQLLGILKPDIIVHLAAVSHAGQSNKNPHTTFDHSLRTLENALDYARSNAKHFIYFSSSMAYGNFKSAEVSEDHPLDPIGIYGALKLAGEKMVIAYNQVFNLPYTIIRPSALYGPRCVSRRVIQIFIENALRGQKLRMEGDGMEKLDFTFIDDLVEGVACALKSPKALNEIFNITYGNSRSIQEVSKIVQSKFPGIEIENVSRDKLMPFRGTLSVAKAKSLIGYEPSFPIDKGVPLYIDWYKEFVGYKS